MSGGVLSKELPIKAPDGNVYILFEGKTFSSYEALEKFMVGYMNEKKQLFTLESTIPIDKARRVTREIHPALKYYSLKLSCKQAGVCNSQSTGARESRLV